MAKNNKTADRVQAIFNLIGGDDMLDALMEGCATIEIKLIQLLSYLGTTSATTEQFVAKDKFRRESKEVKFAAIWDNFQDWFLVGNGKVEEPIGEQILRYGNLTKGSPDAPIIKELGGEAKAKTTLAELYDLLKKQGQGQDGVLLTNGYANIFYIKDVSGLLRSVIAHWRADGWVVCAVPVGYSYDWSVGDRVFSRNS